MAATRMALGVLVASIRSLADDGECHLAELPSTQERGPCMLQTWNRRASSRASFTKEGELAWTTNVGQEGHECKGSRFEVDFNGNHNGMAVTTGLLLKKGNCSSEENRSKPSLTQGLTCEDKVSGCHMWCAPVWHSHHDTTDWTEFDTRCSGWDGDFNSSDTVCSQTGKLFTWARTEVASPKNKLDLTFAISKGCSNWCSPLWVTIYDTKNWAKAFRWCFNKKDEWGVCDVSKDVSTNTWHEEAFHFTEFMQKHGYTPENFVLELSLYSEFETVSTLVNSIKLSTKTQETTTQAPGSNDTKTCGGQKMCSKEHQCCRRGESEVDAKCCPKSWSCCEDSCCPAFYKCTITEFGHTCQPPEVEIPEKPEMCSL